MDPKQSQANELIRRGGDFVEAGQLDQAIAAYREAIALLPGHPAYQSYRFVIGDMLFRLQRYEEAAREYQATVELVPEHDQAWQSLGQCLALSGRYAEAAQACERCVALDPKAAQAWYCGAAAYAKLGDADRARQWLAQALKLQPAWKAQAEQDALLKAYLPKTGFWQRIRK